MLCGTVDIQINTDYNLKFSTQDYKVAFNPLMGRPALLSRLQTEKLSFKHDASSYRLLREALRAARAAAHSNCEGAEFMHPRLQMSIGGCK